MANVKMIRDLSFLFFLSRYHYNVADMRLSQHIEKGYEDGLFISSVGCCSNLWALIMDAGTGFTAQVYELSSFFLHKVVIFCFCSRLSNMCYYVIYVSNVMFILHI